MKTNELKKQLQEKEQQLLTNMARGSADTRKSGGAEMQDRTDQIASSKRFIIGAHKFFG
jgi:hypothetical protein